MDTDKAVELLKKIIARCDSLERDCHEGDKVYCHTADIRTNSRKALALLADKPCETCGGSGIKALNVGEDGHTEYCPDCQPKEQGEINGIECVDETIWGVTKVLEIYGQTDKPVSQQFYQALCLRVKDIIDRLEAENKKLQIGENLYREYYKSHVKEINYWKQQLEKRDNLIKLLFEEISVSKITDYSYCKKMAKQILGDEEFEKILEKKDDQKTL